MQLNRTRRKIKSAMAMFACAFCAAIAMAASQDANRDANRGREVFEKRCAGCHSLDRVKAGPRLRGVYGRKAGRAADFPYSGALKDAPVTWDESTLDRWLKDTESVVPGNDMSFRLDNPGERAAIVAYLKELSAK